MNLQPYMDAVAEVVRDPGSNLTAAALLMAVFVLISLILIITVLLFLLPPRTRTSSSAAPSTGEPRPAAKRGRGTYLVATTLRYVPSWLWWSMVTVSLMAALTYTYVATSTNDYCSSCHQADSTATTWEKSAHAEVACVRCHEGTPVLSSPLALLTRTRYALSAARSTTQGTSATVPPGRCLGCHAGAIAEGSIETTSGIRMEHSHPLEAGISCGACHMDAGHAHEEAASSGTMQVCIRCHDGETASSSCDTCHLKDVGLHAVSNRLYQKTKLPDPTCGGCHDEATCDACHGLRMPHSAGFVEGDHARAAAFDRKTLCWRCHPDTDCYSCHRPFTQYHGGPSFKSRHQSLSWDSDCTTCHARHSGTFCSRCHGEARGVPPRL